MKHKKDFIIWLVLFVTSVLLLLTSCGNKYPDLIVEPIHSPSGGMLDPETCKPPELEKVDNQVIHVLTCWAMGAPFTVKQPYNGTVIWKFGETEFVSKP